ncbi:hypothetical protein [Anaeropeptidivorans aminofermentans]|nr:hypothetical protein [Anaeropeptidivorans aminofermentans]
MQNNNVIFKSIMPMYMHMCMPMCWFCYTENNNMHASSYTSKRVENAI